MSALHPHTHIQAHAHAHAHAILCYTLLCDATTIPCHVLYAYMLDQHRTIPSIVPYSAARASAQPSLAVRDSP